MAAGGSENEQRLARAVRVPLQDFLEIISGRTSCPPELGERLEQRTGIAREVWRRGSVDEIREAVAGLWVA